MDNMTAMEDAFYRAGLADETPQQAAERIWKETGKNPVETMKRFDAWACESPERMKAVMGRYWPRMVRAFLERDMRRDDGWKGGSAFQKALRRKEVKDGWQAHEEYYRGYWSNIKSDPHLVSQKSRANRDYERRKRHGVKRVYADVDVTTGEVSIIDKEFGPFAHIRIDGLSLPEVTTEHALAWCDRANVDTRFIRSLCQMIPDPRKPIGEQWTADMIKAAKDAALYSNKERIAQ